MGGVKASGGQELGVSGSALALSCLRRVRSHLQLGSKMPATLASLTSHNLGTSSQSCGQLALDSGYGHAILYLQRVWESL